MVLGHTVATGKATLYGVAGDFLNSNVSRKETIGATTILRTKVVPAIVPVVVFYFKNEFLKSS